MTVTIERLGHLGDGIAPGPVFAAMTLPGEEVDGEIIDGRIAQPRIVTPSPDRVRPPCSHYKTCGGCSMQHASDPLVAGWKQEIVRVALAAQGLECHMRPIVTSPAQSRRRARLSARRTKKGALVGFHARASDVVVQVPNCQLLDPALMVVIPALEALTIVGASRKGEVGFTITQTAVGIDVDATSVKALDGQLRIDLAGLAAKYGLARLTWDGELVAQMQDPTQRFGVADVTPPPGGFLQATRAGEQSLLEAIAESVGGAKKIADLFSGCGTFSLPLAKTAEVHAVESQADMLAALDRGWRRATGLKRVTTETRDLFRRPLMPDELQRFDAVLIDPPRAGAEAQFQELAASDVPVIAALSCNPGSFARDAKLLCDAGYRLNWLQVVDQFRWSAHVELAAQFTKA